MPVPLAVLLGELRQRGVRLASDGGRLRCGPASVLTQEILRDLRAHEAELVQRVHRVTQERRQRQAFARARVAQPSPSSDRSRPPSAGCYACDNRRFLWLHGGSQWICSRCHNPGPGAVIAAEHMAQLASVWELRKEAVARRKREADRA